LTKVGNLRSFQDELRAQLSTAAREARSVCLVLVDVDNFKSINDSHGHQHGDVVLARLGKLLKTLRASDRAYRLGGDEFALIMPDISGADAKLVAERLREEAPRQLFGATLSFGVAVSEDGGIAPDELQRQADIALYLGKQNGRNSVVTFEDTQRLDGHDRQGSALR
jgi:diguanylate cyclase (GGDEF)-like protein